MSFGIFQKCFRFTRYGYNKCISSSKNKLQLGIGSGICLVLAKQALFSSSVLLTSYGARAVYEEDMKRRNKYLFKFNNLQVKFDSQKLSVDTNADVKRSDKDLNREPNPLVLAYGAGSLLTLLLHQSNDNRDRVVFDKYFFSSCNPETHRTISSLLSTLMHENFHNLMFSIQSFYLANIMYEQLGPDVYFGKDRNITIQITPLVVSSAVFSNLFGTIIKIITNKTHLRSSGGTGIISALLAYILYKQQGKSFYLPYTNEYMRSDDLMFVMALFYFVGFVLLCAGSSLLHVVDFPLQIGGFLFGILMSKYGDEAIKTWTDFVANTYNKNIVKEKDENFISKATNFISNNLDLKD